MSMFHVKPLRCTAWALIAWALLSTPAWGQKVYRCSAPGGATVFSDQPCSPGAGGEISVKPSAGNATAAKNTGPSAAECRRVYQQFKTKFEQPGGREELMKPGNPLFEAWMACELSDPASAPSAQEQARAEAETRKKRAQDSLTLRKQECDTKRQVIASSKARAAQLSDKDRAVLQVVEQEVAQNCK
jgi:hypothetical protein